MHLKSLVLKGFKSFADRSVLSLEPGITAIVGPNGSGKSNISDAVLWVLGERNAKNLRGQAMEDVIFAGSSARKATGLAEVDLVLDNSDGTLPVDYDEVAVTRRMYRNGESEYLINGTVARRMDVLDILHDSGLGTGTHSIISQGSLDSILQSKPEDRRALIEEAAGVLKHKQRKAKSERKLANMDQHLLRARDVVGEVARQLGPLERKAKKARTYQELAGQQAELALSIAVDDLRTLQAQWEAAQQQEAALVADMEEKRAAIQAAEKAVEELQERIRVETLDAGDLSRRHRAAAAAVERFDSTVMMVRERRRGALARAAELELSLEANAVKAAEAVAELERARELFEEARAERETAEKTVADLELVYRDLGVKRGTLEREFNALGKDAERFVRERETAQRKQASSQEALTHGLAHVQVIESHGAELALELERAQAEAEEAAAAAGEAQGALESLTADESAARQAVGTALQSRDAARAAFDEARDAHRALEVEIATLEEVERTSAVSAGEARAWLVEHADELLGLCEPLSHVVHANPGFEALVETLLGGDVATLLVESPAAVEAIVGQLNAVEAEGEAVFLIRDDASPARSRGVALLWQERATGDEGVPLVDELSFPLEAQGAVEALLGDVVVCPTLDDALAAHSRDAFGVRFATPDGSVVWPSGKVSVGASVIDEGTGVLARVRRLEELRGQLGAALMAMEKAEEAHRLAEEALRAAQATSLELSQQLAALKGRAQAARDAADGAAEKLGATRRELEGVERQRQEAEAIISEARPNVENLEKQIADLTQQIDAAKQKQDAIQEELAPLRREAHKVADKLSEAKLAAATLVERTTYAERVRDARERDLTSLSQQSDEARASLKVKRVSAARLEPLLVLFDELTRSAQRWTQSLEEQAAAAQDSSTGLHASVTEARQKAHEAHALFDGVTERLSEARVQKGRLELQVEAAINHITADCKTPLETALATPPLENRPEVEDALFKINRRIANLGTINPDAAEEYDELKVRYDYLAAQLEDLDSARKALAKINRVIDARMKDDFIRTYETVNANFQEIFATLFPGGNANLSLVDPDDLENTGVEVNAQPKGKRIAKMMLLSGGEKSLTALALLFAVYRIRSTPFYILDEVEAALDDSNLRRLAAYINTLRDETQLIMITHQRRTMEMADVLFGVSMQGDGVTKVISQKLDQALKHAE
ncbi:chromosome segregation protein SMC [Adlercreutzia equolifaciens]|uniref:chromosome segregation protein SMC n=1 Tax=Adlercreutzia equolifaciens TaxID=446660 RepID=UPI0023B15957|nr:chromosome segregation protein SMC [Adlercreutzia equolifaciens]MDE8702991.1 chromosome segregation protein SMC [Adlercreutzia equolifaciens]